MSNNFFKRAAILTPLCLSLASCDTRDVLQPLLWAWPARCNWVETRYEVDPNGFGKLVTRSYSNLGSIVNIEEVETPHGDRFRILATSDKGNGEAIALTSYLRPTDTMKVSPTDDDVDYQYMAAQWEFSNLDCPTADRNNCQYVRPAGRLVYGAPKSIEQPHPILKAIRGTLNRSGDPFTSRPFVDYNCKI